VAERLIDRALFWLALMFLEVRLKLRFGFVSVSDKFPPRPEGQPANIAIGGVRCAPDESDYFEFSVWH
jgi:hypothetical protein